MSDKVVTPFEQIRETDFLFMVVNKFDPLNGRIVILACGHRLFTKAFQRARCPRCTEMFRRSCQDGSEDYDSFRRGLIPDRMEWPEDPLRICHEPRLMTEDKHERQQQI